MNKLPGKIISIETEGSIALVEVAVGELKLSASLLGNVEDLSCWYVNQDVQLLFNEMEVAIAKNLSGQISLRNRMSGKIIHLEMGKILTRILFILDGNFTVSAVITSRSARALGLMLGDPIEGLVKSNEMTLISLENQ